MNILKVQEIIRTMEITKVPRAPEFVEGVINLRGKVIPIIDLRQRFGLAPKGHGKNTRIIVIEINNIIVGFVVDAVSEVLRIPASTVQPPPPVVAGVDSDYISGVGKLQDRLLIMLDLDKHNFWRRHGAVDDRLNQRVPALALSDLLLDPQWPCWHRVSLMSRAERRCGSLSSRRVIRRLDKRRPLKMP